MIIIQFIVLVLISLALVKFLSPVLKKIKLPIVVVFIILGILLGDYGLKVNEYIPSLLDNVGIIASIAVLFLFFVSGLNLDIEAVKKKIFSIMPLVVISQGLEILGTTIVALLLFKVLGIDLNIFYILTIMLGFSMSSIANIIPIVVNALKSGKKSGVLTEILTIAATDNILPLPFFMIAFVLGQAVEKGNEITFSTFFKISGLSIIAIAILVIVSYVLILIFNLILKKKINFYIKTLILIAIVPLEMAITGKIGQSLGLVVAFLLGTSFNILYKKEDKGNISDNFSKILGILIPFVFIFAGMNLKLDKLLDIKALIIFSIIVIVAIVIKKEVLGYLYLKKNKDNDKTDTINESAFLKSAFIGKGIVLINMSIILAPAVGMESDLIQTLYILAAVSIILTVPLSIVGMEKNVKKLK